MEPESRLFLMLDQEAVNVSRFYPSEIVSIVSEACFQGISSELGGGLGQERRPRHCIEDQRRYCTTRDARHGALIRGTEPKPSCL